MVFLAMSIATIATTTTIVTERVAIEDRKNYKQTNRPTDRNARQHPVWRDTGCWLAEDVLLVLARQSQSCSFWLLSPSRVRFCYSRESQS